MPDPIFMEQLGPLMIFVVPFATVLAVVIFEGVLNFFTKNKK